MGFSRRKTGRFLSRGILPGVISPILMTTSSVVLRKVLARNPFGAICTTCLWKQNLNEERGTQIILLNFISNSRLNVHVICCHSYSRFYCASDGAWRRRASRACGGNCGRHAAIVECGGGQSTSSAG